LLESSKAYKTAADYKKTHDDLWVSNMSISYLGHSKWIQLHSLIC